MHSGGDIVVVMEVQHKEDTPALSVSLLLGIEQALDDFFEALKDEYDASEDRMVFVSVFSPAFINGPLFLGNQSLLSSEKIVLQTRPCKVWRQFYRVISLLMSKMQLLSLG